MIRIVLYAHRLAKSRRAREVKMTARVLAEFDYAVRIAESQGKNQFAFVCFARGQYRTS